MNCLSKGGNHTAKEFEGIVIEVRGNLALVRPISNEIICSCGCHDEDVKPVIIEAKNEINAAVGDQVILEAPEDGAVMAAFIVFILPFILIFLGIFAGNKMSEWLGINTTAAAVSGGILFLLGSVIIIRKYDKSASKNDKLAPVIKSKVMENYIC